MKINVNGVIREMTADEMERMAADASEPEPTPEERMDEIEAALIELAALLTGGV